MYIFCIIILIIFTNLWILSLQQQPLSFAFSVKPPSAKPSSGAKPSSAKPNSAKPNSGHGPSNKGSVLP